MAATAGGGAGEAMRAAIRAAGGSISFEEFMRRALYDPEHGYYARRVRTVGREGDFSTAATLHPALGQAIAAWAARHRPEARGTDGRWHLIELGPGSGELAAGVLDGLGWWARRGLRCHLVEVSEGLRAAQQKRLGRWGERVQWHATMAEALAAAGGAALIYSNEFVDAFPCARWTWRGGEWRELRVAWPEGAAGPREEVGGVVPEAARAAATVTEKKFARTLPEGQTVEVFASYHAWMREELATWWRGRMLTIDYGGLGATLYGRRPGGTLRAYCRQMRFQGAEVYARIGQQDLTADVNFTDLRWWGKKLGLRTPGLLTQGDFLREWLPARTVAGAARYPRLAALLDPDGAGGAFLVLEQAPGRARARGGQAAAGSNQIAA